VLASCKDKEAITEGPPSPEPPYYRIYIYIDLLLRCQNNSYISDKGSAVHSMQR